MAVASTVYEPQFGGRYSFENAISDCGPLAAIAFARVNGRSPTREEARNLAAEVGWTPQNGMAGPASEQALLTKMGIGAELAPKADEGRMASEVAAGKPVIVSTGLHYFTATDYDPKSGRFYVGPSGTAVRGGKEWMSLAEIDKASRDRGLDGINGALYLSGQPVPQERQQFLEANAAPAPTPPERAVAPSAAPGGTPVAPDYVAQVKEQQAQEDRQQPVAPQPKPAYDPQKAQRDAQDQQDAASTNFALDWLNQLAMPKSYRMPDPIDVAMPKLPLGFG